MKRFLLLIALLSTSFMFSQEVTHVDFDTNNPDIGFESWNTSATFMKVPNPTGVSDPNNISPFVGQFTAGTSDWGQDNTIGIGVVNATSVFSTPFDLTSLDYFKMNVLTLEEVTITFHLENSPDYGNNIEATASISAAQLNQWVELTFDFSSFSNIWMNNIVIKVDGPAWTTSDILFFDDIKGPQLYTSPGLEYNPLNASTEVSLGTNLEIATNDKFYDAGAATITDFTGKVALRVGDINGADVPFTASINGDNNRITIDPDTDLDGLTTYWYGIIDNTIYYSTGTSITGVSASFTTKEAVVGDINVMLFDYETVDTDTPFESWGTAGFAQISNPAPDAVNG
ncbi:MAG: Ig-like domain-containing protein, partial [Bacteroidia bacterium]|nr:Ig-like domain-containing protein [Bacteroidia bacterium]